jgi:probable F420-dependent oxidoreductase
MKVRIGVAVGGRNALDLGEFGALVDELDELRFDSIWIPETFLTGTIDPLVGLAYAAARVHRLKLGTHLVAPGRNPYALAKSLAQLDRLSNGRLLLTFVAGLNDPSERAAQGMPEGDRTRWFDEQLPRLRAWWAGEPVGGLTLDSRPRQEPLEVWIGGQAPTALERVGRLGDGWLPGGITVEDAIRSKAVIDDVAARHGREISPEHFGINISYTFASEMPEIPVLPGRVVADTRDVIAVGEAHLRATLTRWIDAGFTKIIVRPLTPPADWSTELRSLAPVVVDLQT